MKYAPGSFSKNFAWHGAGLSKLHNVIRNGYSRRLTSVRREKFRDKSKTGRSLSLIPMNFFLHNHKGRVSIDELVFQAITRPHSVRFDRLGLFALHLNRCGTGKNVVERPAMWANEFVRERLWATGAWQSSALLDTSLDSFIGDRMKAQPNVRVKCRNNYRHLFELCKLYPSLLPVINSQADEWIASAFFLAWDRYVIDGGVDRKKNLVSLIDTEELYKLLGVAHEHATAQADIFVDHYISIGGLSRLQEEKNIERIEQFEQEESDTIVERRTVVRWEQSRSRRKVSRLKRRYDNTCMFCGTRLQMDGGFFYSEAAHIKGLGQPHNGADKMSNMLILCPNHHLQFDRGVLRLHMVRKKYRIKSKAVGDPLNGKAITLRHTLDKDCVKYHHDWFEDKE